MSYRVMNLLILSPPEPFQVLYQTLAFRDWVLGFRVEGVRDWGLEFRVCMGLSIRTGIIRGIIVPIKGGGAGNQRSTLVISLLHLAITAPTPLKCPS